jgi:outer membrane protein assembly factor BamA
MTKFRLQISVLVLWLLCFRASAQHNYPLHARGIDKDSIFLSQELGIPLAFASRAECMDYINKLPGSLRSKGYITVSIDTIRFDSAYASMVIYIGEMYRWAQLDASGVEPRILNAVGWRDKAFAGKPMDFQQVSDWQEKILSYLETNGHPFAKVYLDSLQIENEKVNARLKADAGPLYKIDSIRVYGDIKLSNKFLQRYLEIPNGSIYNKEKLQRVSRKMRELPFVEEQHPSNLTMLGEGAVLNMYLRNKKSSQVNILLGFLPNNAQLASQKLLLTGEANINLKNALGSGETIGLNWQQLQVKSPRLNLLFQYPFIFNSPLGIDLTFDIFRKDSTFVNINLQLGVQYILNIHQSGKLFLQRFQTIVNGVNTGYVLQNRSLPEEGDVSSVNVGVDYEFNNTDYRLNPRRGNLFHIIGSVGTKKLKENSQILELEDPSDPTFDFASLYDTVKLKTYQFRIKATGEHYFPLAKQSTIKAALNGGIFQSGSVYRNELFQLGGYKLLRGFDEESQYLSQYVIGTFEYRYLVGQNSFFYLFADGGWGKNHSQNTNVDYTYLGTGLGMIFETKAGIFNLAWAVGKRNDTEFNLRQSKIHFGFVNYF